MKKIISILITTIVIGIVGCGSGKETNNSSTNSSLPVDPGEAGKVTLEGIDSDEDGVRDDVQISIVNRYQDDAAMQKILIQQALTLQDALITGASGDANAMSEIAHEMNRAASCMVVKSSNPSEDIRFLEFHVINTQARTDAYLRFNAEMDGQFFGIGSDKNVSE